MEVWSRQLPHEVDMLATGHHVIACVRVHSLAVWIAAGSSSFHRCATSFAKGSSGFGAPSNACIDNNIVLICSAGDQLPSRSQRNKTLHMARRPTFQDIQTYPAKLVYVWMVDLGEETDLWGGHGIVVW